MASPTPGRHRPSPLRIPSNAEDMAATLPSPAGNEARNRHAMLSLNMAKLSCTPNASSLMGSSMTPPPTPPTKLSGDSFSRPLSQPIRDGELALDLDAAQLIGSGLWSKVYKVELALAESARLSATISDLPSPPVTPQKAHGMASQVYAVKTAARTDAKEVFEEEARILNYLSHDSRSSLYVVPFYGLYNSSTTLLLHCASTDLATFSATFSSLASVSPCLDFYHSVSEQLIAGLAHLHRHHVIHTDIKPANILLDFPASGPVARYCDFSASSITPLSPFEPTLSVPLTPGARGPSTSSLSTSLGAGGTWTFMAPELLSINATTNAPSFASDVYALGVTLLTVLLGGASPYRELEAGNLFLFREAIKTGAPVGFARNDFGLGKRLRALEAEDRGRRALAGVAMAVKKKNAERVSADEWHSKIVEGQ